MFHSLGAFWAGMWAVADRVLGVVGLSPLTMWRAASARLLTTEPFVGEVPESVEIRGRSSHAELLPHADLVIGHDGHSTTLRALAHGIPLLILPLNRSSDQPLIGRTAQSTGLGLVLPRTASPSAIADAVRGVLADPAMRAAAADTGAACERRTAPVSRPIASRP